MVVAISWGGAHAPGNFFSNKGKKKRFWGVWGGEFWGGGFGGRGGREGMFFFWVSKACARWGGWLGWWGEMGRDYGRTETRGGVKQTESRKKEEEK